MYHARTEALAAHKGGLVPEIALALAMAYHPRLGASATLCTLPQEMVEHFLAPRVPWTYPTIPLTRGVEIKTGELPIEESLWIDGKNEIAPKAQYRLTFQGDTLMAAGGIQTSVKYLSQRVDGQQLFVDMDAYNDRRVRVAVYHYNYEDFRCEMINIGVISTDERSTSFRCALTDDVSIHVWYDAPPCVEDDQ
jgi:hypothetical protein